MSQVKIYVHLVWTTKRRMPLLASPIHRNKLWFHIKNYGERKGIFVDTINGYHDYCHCLISLSKHQNISDIAKLLKGESSYWFNKSKFIDQKFAWQNEYYATSVSIKELHSVRNYIKNQETHHQKHSFIEERRIMFENH